MGKTLRFMKSLFLYNGFRIEKQVRDLVVVEGFAGVWWLWQNGVSNTVALMGSSCSKEQGELLLDLVEPNGCVWIFTDGDDAGGRCAGSVFLHVAPYRFTRLVLCEEGKQPTDWSPEELLGSFAAMNEESGASDEPIGATPSQSDTEETQQPAAAS
jgi:DNA primase